MQDEKTVSFDALYVLKKDSKVVFCAKCVVFLLVALRRKSIWVTKSTLQLIEDYSFLCISK
jgi:hypothetical protein